LKRYRHLRTEKKKVKLDGGGSMAQQHKQCKAQKARYFLTSPLGRSAGRLPSSPTNFKFLPTDMTNSIFCQKNELCCMDMWAAVLDVTFSFKQHTMQPDMLSKGLDAPHLRSPCFTVLVKHAGRNKWTSSDLLLAQQDCH
jgi:hypothetical protein